MQKSNHKYIVLILIIISMIGIISVVRLSGLMIYGGGDGGGDYDYEPPIDDDTYTDPEIPTNPTILINDGEEITNSFGITLQLSCEKAEDMRFRLSYDTDWTSWEQYNTIKTVLLPEYSTDYPYYRVFVEFRNDDGCSEIVWDKITYEEPDPDPDPIPDPIPDDIPKSSDNTWLWIFAGICISVAILGTLMFLKLKNVNKKKIKRG